MRALWRAMQGATRRHINGGIWRRGATQQRTPHRRNPKGRLPLWRRASFRLLDDPLRWVDFVGAPCPAPQLKPSRPRAVLKHLLRPRASRRIDRVDRKIGVAEGPGRLVRSGQGRHCLDFMGCKRKRQERPSRRLKKASWTGFDSLGPAWLESTP